MSNQQSVGKRDVERFSPVRETPRVDMPEKTCPCCGSTIYEADRVSLWYMTDDHTFRRPKAKSIDELIEGWRRDIKHDSGLMLCPVIVLCSDKEVRRVGEAVHANYRTGEPDSETAVNAYRLALLADPDVERLMALS
jgi:hypothetical protein